MFKVGEIVNNVKILEKIEKSINGKLFWKCQCSCGQIIKRTSHDILKKYKTGKCHACALKTKIKKNRDTPEYKIWLSMRSRCNSKTSNSYKWYGAKGISVCKRWDDFDNFYEDMGRRPSSHHSIDRINVEGHYEPSNCKWSTIKEQNENKRNTIKYKGKTSRQIADELNVPIWTARKILKKQIEGQ